MAHGLYAPGLDIILDGVARDVREFDPGLVVVFNKRCFQRRDGSFDGRYEIYDKNAPGGPLWQLVMRVQEPDGSFRPLDHRVMDSLRKAKGRTVEQLIDEIEAKEAANDAAIKAQIRRDTAGMADDLKYIGRHVAPSVAWRDRSLSAEERRRNRDAIRAAAA